MFCNKELLSSTQWNNANVKDLKPEKLGCQNFKQYLSFSVPEPLLRVDSEKRMLIYQSSAYSTSHSNNCLRAFIIKAFPPVQVCNAAAKDFSSLRSNAQKYRATGGHGQSQTSPHFGSVGRFYEVLKGFHVYFLIYALVLGICEKIDFPLTPAKKIAELIRKIALSKTSLP